MLERSSTESLPLHVHCEQWGLFRASASSHQVQGRLFDPAKHPEEPRHGEIDSTLDELLVHTAEHLNEYGAQRKDFNATR